LRDLGVALLAGSPPTFDDSSEEPINPQSAKPAQSVKLGAGNFALRVELAI
jgi:hypothetical protein